MYLQDKLRWAASCLLCALGCRHLEPSSCKPGYDNIWDYTYCAGLFEQMDKVLCFCIILRVFPIDIQSWSLLVTKPHNLFQYLPSSPRSLTNCTADLAKVCLPVCVEAGWGKLEEYVHPPIDSTTLRCRCFFLRRKSCLIHPYTLFPWSFQESPG